MINGTLTAVALVLGYFVAVGLSMLATFGIANAAPQFIAREHRLKTRYKILQELVWLVCATAGAYPSAWVADLTGKPWAVGALLACILVLIPWTNTWEMRQRGLLHQIILSIAAVAGVGVGYFLQLR